MFVLRLLVLSSAGIPTLGKNVVVAGRSKNVGMPIAMLLHTDGRHERPGGRSLVASEPACQAAVEGSPQPVTLSSLGS